MLNLSRMEEFSIIRERIMIASDTKLLGLVRSWVLHTIRKSNLTSTFESKLVLAIDEAVVNVIEHSYEFQKTGYVDVEIEI